MLCVLCVLSEERGEAIRSFVCFRSFVFVRSFSFVRFRSFVFVRLFSSLFDVVIRRRSLSSLVVRRPHLSFVVLTRRLLTRVVPRSICSCLWLICSCACGVWGV